jgi:putative oxidoreductase
LQRLFSNFADGWPGAGILIQRVLAGSILLYRCSCQITVGSFGMSIVPEMVSGVAGLFLLLGLSTPLAGLSAFLAQLWLVLLGTHLPFATELAATFGLTIAMIGPGAWSIDARLFGRKHIEPRHPQK